MDTWPVVLVRAVERIVRTSLRTWAGTIRLCVLLATFGATVALLLRA